MGNSSLVNYTKLSPNHSGQRTHAIDTITIHMVVGQCSVETLGNIFANPSRQASSNYGIGLDGRIGMYVEEKNRSWCSSSNANDQRAITIETASDTTYPYAVKDVVYKSLINLCVDICKRNGKTKMVWLNSLAKVNAYAYRDNEMRMTLHKWFAATNCPGYYLETHMQDIADKVNAILGADAGFTARSGDIINYTQAWFLTDGIQQITLKKGDKGALVQDIQAYLNYYGWYKGEWTGTFDTALEKAVKAWQKHDGKEVTGQIRYSDWTQIMRG